MGDTCYRNKDGGSGSISEVERGDASIDESGDAGPIADTSLDAGLEDGAIDEPDARVSDAGVPAVDGPHMDAAAIDAAAVDAAAVDASGASDSAAPDASIVTCASNPCENGGSCTDEPSGFRCACPEPFIGDRCEARICPTMFLRTPDDVEKARGCGEIRGDLSMVSAGIGSITDRELPFLTKVTGNMTMSGLANNGAMTPRVRELKLSKLDEVGGSLLVAQAGDGSVEEIHLPSLTRVGGQIFFGDLVTTHLDLRALRRADGDFILVGLDRLCSLDIGAIEHVSARLELVDLWNLPSSTLQPLRDASSGMRNENRIGCCLPIDKACITLSSEERVTSCGCS